MANRAAVNNKAFFPLSDWEGPGGFKSTAAPPNPLLLFLDMLIGIEIA